MPDNVKYKYTRPVEVQNLHSVSTFINCREEHGHPYHNWQLNTQLIIIHTIDKYLIKQIRSKALI